jgi:hypothetical protein
LTAHHAGVLTVNKHTGVERITHVTADVMTDSMVLVFCVAASLLRRLRDSPVIR